MENMNLLENYIQDSYKIEPVISSPVKGVDYIKFIGKVDCYGNVQEETHIWSVEEWKQIRKQGYYLGWTICPSKSRDITVQTTPDGAFCTLATPPKAA